MQTESKEGARINLWKELRTWFTSDHFKKCLMRLNPLVVLKSVTSCIWSNIPMDKFHSVFIKAEKFKTIRSLEDSDYWGDVLEHL